MPEQNNEKSYYEDLQVKPDAHPTIIGYAFKFLAAVYSPQNKETGDENLLRAVTHAYRVLIDPVRRRAYDHALASASLFVDPVSEFQVMNLLSESFELPELLVAILKVLAAFKESQEGLSIEFLSDAFRAEDTMYLEYGLWYLKEKGFIEKKDQFFRILDEGKAYLEKNDRG